MSLVVPNERMLEAFDRIDEIVGRAVALKDLEIATGSIHQLDELKKVAGWSKAYAFYKIREHWHEFEIGDNFQDSMVSLTNHNSQTVIRYIRAWEAIQEAPVEIAQKLLSSNIGNVFSVANAVAQGYDVTDDDWEQVAQLPKPSDVNDYVREEIKEAEPRQRKGSGAFVDREGNVYVVDKDGEFQFAMYVNYNSDVEEVQQLINRVLERSNISKQ